MNLPEDPEALQVAPLHETSDCVFFFLGEVTGREISEGYAAIFAVGKKMWYQVLFEASESLKTVELFNLYKYVLLQNKLRILLVPTQ